MNIRRNRFSGFTLIELIIVMVIIAIIAAVAAPSLGVFSKSRLTNNAASQILVMARYARAQSISEGRIYRLNFDTGGGQYWLTADDGTGIFAATGQDGQRTVPSGVKMDVQITLQPNILQNKTDTQQQLETSQQSSQTLI